MKSLKLRTSGERNGPFDRLSTAARDR